MLSVQPCMFVTVTHAMMHCCVSGNSCSRPVSIQGQKPSSKYVEQAKEFTSDAAASKIADAPTINKKGGGVGRADFAPSQQPGIKEAAEKNRSPTDIRGGMHPAPPIIQYSACHTVHIFGHVTNLDKHPRLYTFPRRAKRQIASSSTNWQ